MNRTPYVLLVAPNAPPRNTAESIQVRRILAELDTHVSGRLVTVMPDASGSWAQRDASLEVKLTHFDTDVIALPLHRFTNRALMSHRFGWLHVPDSMFWISFMAGRVVKNLPRTPDIIYSRSSPMSAALLARKLKLRLNVPWIMHLSDPWAENPDKTPQPRDPAYEANCFHEADLITLTTEGQAEFYRKKYPELARKIIVSPNVMPDAEETAAWLEYAPASFYDARLHLVFAGNLYGNRSPEPLMDAIDILRATRPEILQRVRIDFYGHAQKTALPLLERAKDVVHYHGSVSFRKALAVQHAADAAITIEASNDNFLVKNTLLSKVTDCLTVGTPMLAITPDDSETARICNEGYGWSAATPHALANRIAELTTRVPELRAAARKAAPARYAAKSVTADLVAQMYRLMDAKTP